MSLFGEFEKAMEDACDGQFVTGFFIVFETSDGAQREIHMATSEGMTPWLLEGMLNFAQRASFQMGGLISDE